MPLVCQKEDGPKGGLLKLPLWAIIASALAAIALSAIGIILLSNLHSEGAFPGYSVVLFLLVMLAAGGCEFIDSGLGMGYGTTLTPILLLAGFEPLQVVPPILLSELFTGILAGFLHQKEGNLDLFRDATARKTTIILAALSVVGASAAVFLALKISKLLLGTIIGSIVTLMGIIILITFRQTFRFKVGHIVALGAIAAFNKGLSGGGYGPLVTGGQVVSGVSPKQAVGITSIAEAATCLVAIIVYFASGQKMEISLVLPLLLGGLMSVPFSVLTIRRLTAIKVRLAIGLGTLLLGLLSLAKLWL